MTTIQKFEAAKASNTNLVDLGINPTMYWAYRNSQKAGNDLIDFSEVIWDNDVKAIADTCREEGITEFTISSRASSLVLTLHLFEGQGVRMDGIVQVNANYDDWQTGKLAVIPAIRMVVG